MLAAVYWARAPRVVLPDRALCLPTFCHSLLTVNKSSSSSSSKNPFQTGSMFQDEAEGNKQGQGGAKPETRFTATVPEHCVTRLGRIYPSGSMSSHICLQQLSLV